MLLSAEMRGVRLGARLHIGQTSSELGPFTESRAATRPQGACIFGQGRDLVDPLSAILFQKKKPRRLLPLDFSFRSLNAVRNYQNQLGRHKAFYKW